MRIAVLPALSLVVGFSTVSVGTFGVTAIVGAVRPFGGSMRFRGVATGGLVLATGSLGVEGLIADAATWEC